MNVISKLGGLISQIVGYINAFGEYIKYIKNSISSIFDGGGFPPVILLMVGVSMVCLVLYFIRGR